MLGEQQGGGKHHEEPDGSKGDGEAERAQDEDEAGDGADDAPPGALGGVEAMGAVIDARDELTIVLTERLLHLLEDPLFIFGKWHRSPPSRPLGTPSHFALPTIPAG